LKDLIREAVDEKGAEMEAMPQLLVEDDPQHGTRRLVKATKGRSSRVLREEFPSSSRRAKC